MEVPLVGRSGEVAQLRAAVLAAAGGAGHLVLISGDPGMGKTRLATAAAELAGAHGLALARGHAVDDPGMPPMWPWQRVARGVPELARVLTATDRAAGPADSAAARFAMFSDACQVLIRAAAATGLLVVLEDLQWADRTSLRLLRQLSGELAASRLLVLGTMRDTAEPATHDLLGTLAAARTRSIRLAGLTRADLTRWLRVATPDGVDRDALAARLATGTGGNPLFVRMLLERMADRGTFGATGHDLTSHPELRRLVLARFDELAAPTREVLGAAAVLGERIHPPVLADITARPPAELARALDEATAAGVLRCAPDTAALSFAHALVRDAIHDELPPSRRAALHHATALALERAGADPGSGTAAGPALAGPIAVHWRRSGRPDATARCVRWARVAAASATAGLAHDEAVRFATLAVDAADDHGPAGPELRAELLLELARAEYAAGRVVPSLAHCESAARLAGQAGRPDLLAAAALVVTGVGDPPMLVTVDRLCAAALRAVPPDDTAVRGRLLAQRAIAVADTGTAADHARQLSAQALELAERSGDPDALLDGIHARHFTLSAPQFLAERVELGRRACELAEFARQPLAALWGHVWLVDAAFQRGDLPAVDHQLRLIEEFATARRHPLARWHLTRLRATRAALVGDLDDAVALNEAARDIAGRIGEIGTAGMYHAFLGQLALLRGTIDPAVAQAALAMMRRVPDLALVRISIPATYALLGDLDSARATFEEFRRMPPTVQIGPRWAALLSQIGVVAIMLDDAETADLVYRCLSVLDSEYMGDGSGAVFSGGATARLLGDLALTSGQVPQAITHYRDAIERNARIGARPFLALSRLGLARALTTRADPTDLAEARRLATDAAAQFRRLDLPGPLAAATALLATIESAAREADPLSRRESEVADLVAQALSNRQIARRLVLSERTVEAHVRNILAKLGYSTRTEIATWRTRTSSARPATTR